MDVVKKEGKLLVLALLLIFALALGSTAANCGGVTACSCGDNVTSSYNFTSSLTCSLNESLNVISNDTILDCQGFTINTISPDNSSALVGINITNGANNVTVQNCNLFTKGVGDDIAAIQILADNNSIIVNNSLNHSGLDTENDSIGILTIGTHHLFANNSIEGFDQGMFVFASNQSTILNNTIKHSRNNSIWLFDPISLYDVLNNTFINTTVTHIGTTGQILTSNISNNLFQDFPFGITTSQTILVTMGNNTFTNGTIPMFLNDSVYDQIGGNTLKNGSNYAGLSDPVGMWIIHGEASIITRNNITNFSVGINFTQESNNFTIFDNYFANNTIHVSESNGAGNNTYNSSYFCSDSTVNIVGGNCTGGNFWDNYVGTDSGNDGIGDTNLPFNDSNLFGLGNESYVIGGDALPLVIQNLAPVFTSITTTPVPTFTNDTLNVTVVWTDEGVSSSNITFNWTRDGVLIKTETFDYNSSLLNYSSNLSSDLFNKTQNITVYITLDDNVSVINNQSFFNISNSPPYANTSFTNLSLDRNSSTFLNLSLYFYDIDPGDSLSFLNSTTTLIGPSITGENLTITSNDSFGSEIIFINATDGENTTLGSNFTVAVNSHCGNSTICGCGHSLNESYTMTSDLTCNRSYGFSINANDSVLDCAGFAINMLSPDNNTVLSGLVVNSSSHNITVKNCNVNTKGFGAGMAGLELYANNSSILDNNFTHLAGDDSENLSYGIFEFDNQKSLIERNRFINHNMGVFTWLSNLSTYRNNTALNNLNFSFYFFGAGEHHVADNTIRNTTIGLHSPVGSSVLEFNFTRNNVSNATYGGFLIQSGLNTYTNNTFYDVHTGLLLFTSVLDITSGNNIYNGNNESNFQSVGLHLINSQVSFVFDNNITNFSLGVNLSTGSNDLRIYNNFFNNSIDLAEDSTSGNNSFNSTVTCSPTTVNIVGGNCTGGNFWSSYTGVDNDGDFIGDTLIPFNDSNRFGFGDQSAFLTGGDYYPLVFPPTPATTAQTGTPSGGGGGSSSTQTPTTITEPSKEPTKQQPTKPSNTSPPNPSTSTTTSCQSGYTFINNKCILSSQEQILRKERLKQLESQVKKTEAVVFNSLISSPFPSSNCLEPSKNTVQGISQNILDVAQQAISKKKEVFLYESNPQGTVLDIVWISHQVGTICKEVNFNIKRSTLVADVWKFPLTSSPTLVKQQYKVKCKKMQDSLKTSSVNIKFKDARCV